MQRLVATAMDQGAFGLSTGLTLPPSAYGDTDEIVALASVMAGYPGRFYTSHLRGWSGQHVSAVAEALEIGRRAGVPVQVSHMAINEPSRWGQADRVIEVCQQAVDAGQDVTFDVYPYAASSSGFSQCLPTWAQSGGRRALVERLRDPATRAAIRADMVEHGLFRGWPWMWDRLMISSAHSAEVKPFEGKTFQHAAEILGNDPLDAALDLMDWDDGRMAIIFFYRTEEDMRAFLRHPLGMMGSDGSAIDADGPLGKGKPHPRSYGAHVRVLGRYVREERVLSLE
jgi:N-acyl-D-aspartate/D-glutamate deacylase